MCKKRKSFNGKSPKELNSGSHKLNGGAKSYKHIKLMPLNIIKQVIDIKETEGKWTTLYKNSYSKDVHLVNVNFFTIYRLIFLALGILV